MKKKYLLVQYFLPISTIVSVVFLLSGCFTDAAPAFKFKKSFSSSQHQDRYLPPRLNSAKAERRFVGKTSPIHYITPYLRMPEHNSGFQSYFGGQAPMASQPGSSIYKLPLRLYANGKPHVVFQVIPKRQNIVDYFPQTVSKIIRLPLKYMSNAKPVGVYLKDPAYNFL